MGHSHMCWQDKAARSFTLIHELSHIFLGSTGISGAPSTIEPRSPIARVERFCNDVAGEFLLPEAAITTVGFMEDVHAAMDVAHEIADQWKVSEAMVARPMDLGRSRRCIGLASWSLMTINGARSSAIAKPRNTRSLILEWWVPRLPANRTKTPISSTRLRSFANKSSGVFVPRRSSRSSAILSASRIP